ncbi:MAG: hypothetical protein LBU40_03660, partial [Methanobrevibacter sp.]|nr:hypothetical protein [Methanobrevibacter sp.]
MEIDENKKILLDKENKYLFDDRDIVVFLDNNEDFKTIQKYSKKGYSIKANVKGSDNTEFLTIKNYSVSKAKTVEDLKESNRWKMFLLDKLGIKSSKKGGLIVLSF